MPRWLRTLAYLQIIGGICCMAGSLVPRGWEQGTYAFTLVLFPLSAGTLAAIAGCLLLIQVRHAVYLSIIAQALQVITFSGAWRMVFEAGLWVTWVINSSGTGLEVGGGGAAIATGAPQDGTLRALGYSFQVTLGLFGRSRNQLSWSVGINVVALCFLVALWRELQRERLSSNLVLPSPAA